MSRQSLSHFQFTFVEHGSYVLDDLLQRAAWHPAQLPGDSIEHLRRAGLEILDPLRGDNQKAYLKYERHDFIYRTRIHTRPGFHYLLNCDGLDTFCDIYLDGGRIHRHESSFIRLRLDLGRDLGGGAAHELVFVFLSPTEHAAQTHPDFEPGAYAVVFDEPRRVLIRKPQFHYGWDNAPHLAGVGFIGKIELEESAAPLRVDDVHFQCAYDWKARHARFSIRLDGEAWENTGVRVSLSFEGRQVWRSDSVQLGEGRLLEVLLAEGELAGVHEWQVRGHGQPHRYTLALENAAGESIWQRKVGFRDVQLSTRVVERRTINFRVGSCDEQAVSMDGSAETEASAVELVDGLPAGAWSKVRTQPYETDVHEFRVVINGTPVFLKGFNWQPLEPSRANVTDQRWKDALALYDNSQANTLRIWGGGYIEDDRLYEFCDEAGILVWQDFQFACALYPDGDPAFRDVMKREVRDIYLRLHCHPSVGVFCGSNEIDMMLHDRGRDVREGNQIGYQIIPEILGQLRSTIPYHVSSPSGEGYPRNPFSGDTRNWTAREYVEDDYPLLRGDPAVLNSEGGAPSFPNRHLADYFLPEGKPFHESTFVASAAYQLHAGSTLRHDRGKGFFDGMYRNVRKCFCDWRTLDELVYATQLFQADALARYVEVFRFKEDHCGGCLIWKFSDVWPCLELAVVDYSLHAKMAYHAVRRAFADTIICPFLREENITFSVSSTRALGEARLQVDTLDMSGRRLSQVERNLPVDPGINPTDLQISRPQLRQNHGTGNAFFRARLLAGARLVAERIFLPETYRQMNFVRGVEPEVTLSPGKEVDGSWQYELSLKAPATLLGVDIGLSEEFDVPLTLSDNAFHLVSGDERQLTLKCKHKLRKPDLRIQSLNAITAANEG